MEKMETQDQSGGRVSVKESIKYICELITSLGVTGITPEALRLAKFNKLESPRCLLLALHDIATLSSAANPQPQVWEDEEILGFVKFNLALWGYPPHSPLFTRHCSSRQFLLALGWMISHCDLIAKGLTRRLQPLLAARNGAPLPDDYPLDMGSSCEAMVRARDAESGARNYVQRMIAATDRVHNEAVKTEMRVDQALMLYGQVRHSPNSLRVILSSNRVEGFGFCQVRASQNAIAALRESKVKKLHDLEVAQLAAGVRHPHSPYELHLLQHPKKLDSHCEAIAAATAIEEETEACRKHEALLWKWMESVAHEELSHSSPFDHLDLTGVPEAELAPAIQHLKTTLERNETPSSAETLPSECPDVPAEESLLSDHAKVMEASLLKTPVFVYKPEKRPVKATLRKEEENDPRTASSKLKRWAV